MLVASVCHLFTCDATWLHMNKRALGVISNFLSLLYIAGVAHDWLTVRKFLSFVSY